MESALTTPEAEFRSRRSDLLITAEGVLVHVKARQMWEPYVEAVLARQKAPDSAALADTTSEQKTGLKVRGAAPFRLGQDERGWLRLAG